MFKFLKEKLGKVISSISKKAEEAPKKEETKEKKGIVRKITETVTTQKISGEKFNKLFEDIELVLLENNTALEVVEKIKEDLKKDIVNIPIKRGNIEKKIKNSLKNSIKDLFTEKIDLIKEIKKNKPYIICFIGINGSGKTTTIAKIANLLKKNNLKLVLAASDTFRAAAIDQLQVHADKLKVKLIKHNYGSDPAAVAFDAIKYAQAKNLDVVLIDTAGRMHTNINLINEMKKIIKVAKPNLTIFVGESIAGNDCIVQAEKFNDEIGIDAIILAKSDVDEKGGTAISVSYVTKKPIIYLGTGQSYNDIETFDSEKLIKTLGLE